MITVGTNIHVEGLGLIYEIVRDLHIQPVITGFAGTAAWDIWKPDIYEIIGGLHIQTVITGLAGAAARVI